VGLIGMKRADYEKKKNLQKIKTPFVKLMSWIGNAQKGKAVCKS
jgi:hypothetical protein